MNDIRLVLTIFNKKHFDSTIYFILRYYYKEKNINILRKYTYIKVSIIWTVPDRG